MKSKPFFIDTSFFKALIDKGDEFHPRAQRAWARLKKETQLLATSNYIIDETATLLRCRIGLKTALKFRQIVTNSLHLKLERVLIEDEALAWEWFKQNWSGLSFTDCVCFAQMKRLGITKICTFDHHFARAKFEIIP